MPKRGFQPETHLIHSQFYKNAHQMRRHFDGIFSSPNHSSRFVWDSWNVPGQYNHLRTPAYHFFPKSIYEPFHRSLVQWGRENLGCHDISPPWLSCYMEGHYQGFHADLPHGPWAFVFSLTHDQLRDFTGGETVLLKPQVLNYWRDFRSGKGKEENQIFKKIPPRFNQLLIFDPRVPHSVQQIRGTRNLVEGRLVIHGWFVQPRPFFVGPLTRREIDMGIRDLTLSIAPLLRSQNNVDGILPLKLKIKANGAVERVRLLPHTLQSTENLSPLIKQIVARANQISFKRKRAGTRLVLPLVFESTSSSR